MFRELLCQRNGVVTANLEGDDRADVAEHGIGGAYVELLQVLVCDGEIQPVLSGFR